MDGSSTSLTNSSSHSQTHLSGTQAVGDKATPQLAQKPGRMPDGRIVYARRRNIKTEYEERKNELKTEKEARQEEVNRLETTQLSKRTIKKKTSLEEEKSRLETQSSPLTPKEQKRLDKVEKSLSKFKLAKAQQKLQEAEELQTKGLTDEKLEALSSLQKDQAFLAPFAAATYNKKLHSVTVFSKEGFFKPVSNFLKAQRGQEKAHMPFLDVYRDTNPTFSKFSFRKFVSSKVGYEPVKQQQADKKLLRETYATSKAANEKDLLQLKKDFPIDARLADGKLALTKALQRLAKSAVLSKEDKQLVQTWQNYLKLPATDLNDQAIEECIKAIDNTPAAPAFTQAKATLDRKAMSLEAYKLLADNIDAKKLNFLTETLDAIAGGTGGSGGRVSEFLKEAAGVAARMLDGFGAKFGGGMIGMGVGIGFMSFIRASREILSVYNKRAQADTAISTLRAALKDQKNLSPEAKQRYEELIKIAKNAKDQTDYAKALSKLIGGATSTLKGGLGSVHLLAMLPALPLALSLFGFRVAVVGATRGFSAAKESYIEIKRGQAFDKAHEALLKAEYKADNIAANPETQAILKQCHLDSLERGNDYAISFLYNTLQEEHSEFVKDPLHAELDSKAPTYQLLKAFVKDESKLQETIKAVLLAEEPEVGMGLLLNTMGGAEATRIGHTSKK